MSRLIRLENDFNSLTGYLLEWQAVGSAAATAANYPVNFFTAPFPCVVRSVVVRFGTASSSGTFTINKAPSGTATGSGTAILTATVSLAGTANTAVSGTIDSTAGVLQAGDTLGFVTGGTLTSLADLVVTIFIAPIRLSV